MNDPTVPGDFIPTLELIAGLVEFELQTKKGIVVVYNQKRNLPPATGFFVDVSMLGSRPFGNNSTTAVDPETADLVETVEIRQQEMVQIDIFSFDDSARMTAPFIPAAFSSVHAQQVCDANAIKLAQIPQSVADASSVEASARLNRYALAFALLRTYSRKRAVPTFTQFSNPPSGRNLVTNQ